MESFAGSLLCLLCEADLLKQPYNKALFSFSFLVDWREVEGGVAFARGRCPDSADFLTGVRLSLDATNRPLFRSARGGRAALPSLGPDGFLGLAACSWCSDSERRSAQFLNVTS